MLDDYELSIFGLTENMTGWSFDLVFKAWLLELEGGIDEVRNI